MRMPKLPTHAQLAESRATSSLTGRYMIVFRPGGLDDAIALLQKEGFKVADARDSAHGVVRETDAPDADIIVYPRTGIALLSGEGDHLARVSAIIARSANGPILSVTQEGVIIGCDSPPAPPEMTLDTAVSWAVSITGATSSKFTGAGVKVAFADSGIDLNHPDFKGRIAETFCAVPNTIPQDVVGHGTHCTGVACGPLNPVGAPRYGIAPESEIVAIKVMTDASIGAPGWIVAGCEWAIANQCRIVCLALQEPTSPNQGFNPTYEQLGKSCLAANTLLIAAAGNDSDRGRGSIRPVASPADCPSIMGVGAVGFANNGPSVANFSNAGGLNGAGSDVDLAAPGVSIPSAFPGPTGYTVLSGTSQAAAVVTGVAALLLQMNAATSAVDLWRALVGTARRLPFSTTDVGAGLVWAPQ